MNNMFSQKVLLDALREMVASVDAYYDANPDKVLKEGEEGDERWHKAITSARDIITNYQQAKGLTFGMALHCLKSGLKVARQGWNGKGMWLYLVPGSTFQVAEGRPLAAHLPVGETVNYHAHIDMKTAQDTHVPWLASQTDVLAEDWIAIN